MSHNSNQAGIQAIPEFHLDIYKWGGGCIKNWWWGCVATMTQLFQLALTHWPHFLTHSHPMTQFFQNISSKCSFFSNILCVENMFKFVFCLENWLKLVSHLLTPFLGFSLNDPVFFLIKNPHGKIPSYELLSEHLCPLKVECPSVINPCCFIPQPSPTEKKKKMKPVSTHRVLLWCHIIPSKLVFKQC